MTETRRYAVVYEPGDQDYSAYVPDLPGRISVGETFADVERNIREAIGLYLEELAREGVQAPVPATRIEYVSA